MVKLRSTSAIAEKSYKPRPNLVDDSNQITKVINLELFEEHLKSDEISDVDLTKINNSEYSDNNFADNADQVDKVMNVKLSEDNHKSDEISDADLVKINKSEYSYDTTEWQTVYVDGACRDNRKKNARASIGVY